MRNSNADNVANFVGLRNSRQPFTRNGCREALHKRHGIHVDTNARTVVVLALRLGVRECHL